MAYSCKFCIKEYKTQRGLDNHVCRNMEIAAEYGDLEMLKTYELFAFWFQYNGFSKKKAKTFNEFLKSPYFKEFVKMNAAIKGVYMFNKKDFVVWLSENKIPIDHWARNSIIERYKTDHDRRGRGLDHFNKTIENIVLWCDIKNYAYHQFFEHISVSDAMLWLQSGKLSPWYFLNTDKINLLWARMSEAQLEFMLSFIDIDYWEARFKVNQTEVQTIKDIINDFDF